MNSYLVYRASFYLMLIVASLALVGDTAEGRFAAALHRGRDGLLGSSRFSLSISTGSGPCRDR